MPWLIVSAPKRTMNWLPSLVSSHCLAILFFKTIASPWRATPLWGTDTFHGCRPRSGEDPCFLGSGLWIDHFWWTTWHSTCLLSFRPPSSQHLEPMNYVMWWFRIIRMFICQNELKVKSRITPRWVQKQIQVSIKKSTKLKKWCTSAWRARSSFTLVLEGVDPNRARCLPLISYPIALLHLTLSSFRERSENVDSEQ